MSKRIVKLTESDLVKIIKKVINEQVRREHLDWFKNENFEIEIDGNKSYLEIQNVDSDRNTEDKFYIYTKKIECCTKNTSVIVWIDGRRRRGQPN